MSQLLIRLRSELNCTTEIGRRIELLARIALQLARMGSFDQARLSIHDARGLFMGGHGGVATMWIMLAEGVTHLFESQSSQAMGRIAPAQMLALSAGHRTLIANTSVWKAHLEFEASNFEAMVKSLKIAKTNVDDTDHDAQVRLAIVLSNAFALCGCNEWARMWFSRAHRHAVDNQDQASLDAVIYNHAALGLASLRVKSCVHDLEDGLLKRVRLEVFSSTNFTALIKGGALKNHVELIEGRLLILEGKYEAAAGKLRIVRGLAPFASNHLNQDYIDLELCYCATKLGDRSELERFVKINWCAKFEGLDLDDQVVAAYMVGYLSAIDSRLGDPLGFKAEFEMLYSKYEAWRSALAFDLECFSI